VLFVIEGRREDRETGGWEDRGRVTHPETATQK